MTKSSQQRSFLLTIFLIGFSLLLWCYLFRLYLNASAPLQGDAYPYLGHIRFYVENIMRGVYPLWDPLENHGNVNEFFLRRIGEYNPFFLIIVLLNKSGIPFLIAYRLFLVSYFFLGVAGFYLLSQKIFFDHLTSFSAALLFLFSSVGASIFETYLLLEIVPFIWFFYFFVSFVQAPNKVFLLGSIFSLMLINITYIPFYFYTILSVFLICFSIVYASQMATIYQRIQDFISHYKIFTRVCTVLLAVSFIPGILWYQQTSQGEVLTMERHAQSQDTNSATVSVDKVNEGGIIPNFIFNRQFVNPDKIGLHDIYIPLFAFLMLFAGAWGRLNRRLIVFFIFGYTIFLIGLADASYIHRFLYRYVLFFKYFRNVQFFIQFAILPVLILFVVEQMRIFIEDCKQSLINRKWMTVWVTTIHAAAAGFFLFNNAGYITYMVIILNLGWMLGCIWSIGNSRVWILLLWGAIVLQPFDVYSHIAVNNPPSYQWGYDKRYVFNLPTVQEAGKLMDMKKISKGDIHQKDLPYFGTRWLYEAIDSVDSTILGNHLNTPFVLYDRVEQVTDKVNHARLQNSLAHFENLAFVYSDTMRGAGGPVDPKARIITSVDKDFKILKFDANDVIVKIAVTHPSFLVRAQNYHSQWKVFIDGKPAPLLRTNICSQGLWVPAGEHVIHWHFGTPLRYFWVYFLEFLYLFVLGWLIWLWFHFRLSTQKLSI